MIRCAQELCVDLLSDTQLRDEANRYTLAQRKILPINLSWEFDNSFC